MSLRRQRTRQPQQPTAIEWGNSITSGLNFAAIPVGGGTSLGSLPIYVDCVTGEFGVNTDNKARIIAPHGGGKSRQHDGARAGSGANISTSKVAWSTSTQRGGTMVNTGTILALASTATQVDGNVYTIGGNTDGVSSGNGFILAIDSFLNIGRGNILKTDAVSVKGVSAAELLGNPFDNRLHFFGYSFTGNGTDGNYFAEGNATAYTGGSTHGSTTTNRQAVIFHPGYSGFGSYRTDSNVALLLMWDRALMAFEYRALYANPWQVFVGVPRRVHVRAPVSAFPVLSAATVTSITSTGATPRVTITI